MANTKEQISRNMKSNKGKDTKPELLLRKELWRRGLRYRKNYKELYGKPDIVLTKYKIAIFCDSEFFHGKDWDKLKVRLEKGQHPEYWLKKITRNMVRDAENNEKLVSLGWTVLHFWGQDILKHLDVCLKTIEETIIDLQKDTFPDKDYLPKSGKTSSAAK